MKSKQNVSVVTTREVIGYAAMWHTSKCLLERGQEEVKASYHQFMASLVFTAFTIEAYLNHAGQAIFACWGDLERLGPEEKLNVISERLALSVDYGAKPWQIMNKIFKFRNAIVHGKSKTLKAVDLKRLDTYDTEGFKADWFKRTDWESFCTERNSLEARRDVEAIIMQLNAAAMQAGFDVGHPFVMGHQSRQATLVSR